MTNRHRSLTKPISGNVGGIQIGIESKTKPIPVPPYGSSPSPMSSPMELISGPRCPSFCGPHPSPHLCEVEACVIGTHASVPSVRGSGHGEYRSCPGSHAVGPRHALRQRFRQRPDGARVQADYATRLTATANRPPPARRCFMLIKINEQRRL